MASSSSSPTSIAASFARARSRMGGQGQGHLPVNLPGGLSISRTSAKPASSAGQRQRNQQPAVLSSGEVVGGGPMGPCDAMTPCTPYCPGVTGFPELECRGCQSLFHGKCVGVSSAVIDRIQGTWMCRMCKQMSLPQTMQRHNAAPPMAAGGAPPVIDLD